MDERIDFKDNQKSSGTRNYSLDLLRIISMLMIVCLHVFSHGGLSEQISNISTDSIGLWLIQAISVASVNIFVLLSGYFLVNDKFRPSKLMKLLIQVWFYSWIIWFILIARGYIPILSKETISSLLPISFRNYWFISAYFGMYLLVPISNKLINSLNKVQHLTVIIGLVCIMSVWTDVIPKSDAFVVSYGQSVTWFIVLYIIAAYIRRYVKIEEIKYRYIVFVYSISVIFLVLSKVFLYIVTARYSFISEFVHYEFYYRYNSFLVLLSAVSLLLMFLKIKLNNGLIRKTIQLVTPLTVGVYLIHDNPNIRPIIWDNIFYIGKIRRDVFLLPKVVGIILIVFCGCILIDFIRKMIFNVFERTGWYKNVMQKLDLVPYKLQEKINKKFSDLK